MRMLFESVATEGVTDADRIRNRIASSGIDVEDFRLRTTMERLARCEGQPIGFDEFAEIVGPELRMVSRSFSRQLAIPDWEEFCSDIRLIYDNVAPDRGGNNADYIPILRDADPERWGVAFCTVDGQRMRLGDVDVFHSIQSVSKPLNYAYALLREGSEFTHRFVGTEPSGRPFNALDLLPDMRPFNPCVNAGAIMTAGIIASGSPDREAREITGDVMNLWSRMCGGIDEVRFSEETMLSERATAHTNYAIAYLLQGRTGLPRDVSLHTMLDLYLSCCSIEMTSEMLAIAAATLANGGVCPITGEEVLPTEVVKKTLAVMQSAGMYDNAGSFTLEVGLPAKSGVAGAVLVVVPNLMGFATFSPRLDDYGNSVRGVAFCRQLVDRFTFHIYDSLSGGHTGCKRDPRASQHDRKERDLSELRWAVAYGDRYAIKVRDLMMESMVDICLADGEIMEDEIHTIATTYAEIMGQPPSREQLDGWIENRRAASGGNAPAGEQAEGPFEQLLRRLSDERSTLDDNGREVILEAAFRVACSDGSIEERERAQLRGIARALGINEGVLELEIARFQRLLART
ncbi:MULTISPECIES: glutaminase A [Aphanothece]|uniref:glutaminase A n=1 Tax=Aphanothece TaxID=1121 RepID=UPI00398F5BC2